ncbi:DUF305 domain-containing protein [Arthrobacter agilis]|uniref:DUF305 domain-containing protein n=1 Tax=Arthrobacter agilis TaxID=37921 RepID=UPI000B364049|nr:DUF305 domain-containing protein [Arthrobacter agilis]OUM42191.1 DUF305 domain-containing protein [Arthrobacter agilis]PPB45535.1 DUF305 domain-containing protein [Arthrobacter agilis]TPV26489.1 DUF305 domain-containing protein [Arthrobacter agilis]VDR33605.1 Uncharacterized protein conserved in bacteria [Arthrobacter agilis]
MTLSLPGWQKRLLLILSALAVVALFALAFSTGRMSAAPTYPDTTSADAGFARDMQAHHNQAVEMSLIVRDKVDDETLRAVAYDIATTQQQQAGQMYAWLEEWGLSQSSSQPRMQWMSAGSGDHGGMDMGAAGSSGSMLESDGRMPGMATDEQLDQLRAASGDDAARLFLNLMITHHLAGVDMAKAGAELGTTDQVRDLALKMQAGQQSEIALMRSLLDKL